MDKDNIKIGDLVTWSDPYFINMSINKTNMTKNIGIVLDFYFDKESYVKVLSNNNYKNNTIDVLYKFESEVYKL